MEYKISKPSQFLSRYIKYYWSLDNCIPLNKEHIQRIVPSGLFELIFYLKDKPQMTNHNNSISDSIILTGQLKNYHDLKVSGNLSLFAIYFLPHGLSMFLDLPIKELFNKSIPLKYLIKNAVHKLEDELSNAETFEKQIVSAKNFLMSQMQKVEKKYKYNRIRYVINEINKAKGVLNINDLASESFLSRKQFERTFAEIIGISPKQFLKIVRFQNVIFEKSKPGELNITELAYKCGYYDQAHMINDFNKLSGMAPMQYFTVCEPYSDYFQ